MHCLLLPFHLYIPDCNNFYSTQNKNYYEQSGSDFKQVSSGEWNDNQLHSINLSDFCGTDRTIYIFYTMHWYANTYSFSITNCKNDEIGGRYAELYSSAEQYTGFHKLGNINSDSVLSYRSWDGAAHYFSYKLYTMG